MDENKNSEKLQRKQDKQQQNFMNIFVNAVYGILLGFGFGSSIKEIYLPSKQANELLFQSLHENTLEYSIVLFAIIILCVHWWDWKMNVGQYAKTNVLEFTINMLILINLEWLFFDFDNLLNFSFLMATLAFLNFLWVLTFRWNRYDKEKFTPVKYILRADVTDHILRRLIGVVLYTGFFILFYLCHNQIDFLCDMGRFFSKNMNGQFWAILLMLAALFTFDRVYLYRDRVIFRKGEPVDISLGSI